MRDGFGVGVVVVAPVFEGVAVCEELRVPVLEELRVPVRVKEGVGVPVRGKEGVRKEASVTVFTYTRNSPATLSG